MDSNIILFGGSGLFGPSVLERYPNIISVGRSTPPSYVKNKHISVPDLDDLSALDSLDFDKVIFLIGNSNHHLLNTQAMMGLDFNVIPLVKALHYFEKRQLKKLICFSTILLYDWNRITPPVDESQPINPYANNYVFSKYLSEQVVRFYENKVPIIVVRLSNIYGPTWLTRPDLVPTLIQNLLTKPDEITIWSKKPVRDFLYMPDAADAIVKLLDTDYTGIVNLGAGRPVGVRRVTEILEGISGKKIVDLDKEVSGPMNFYCDTTLVNKLTSWQPKYSIEEGLCATYDRMKGLLR